MKNEVEYQVLWELEVWKRAEQQKFKAHLKQVELESVQKVTNLWTQKEQQFTDSLQVLSRLEKRLKEKAHELQKRETRIVNLEEDMKLKMQKVT